MMSKIWLPESAIEWMPSASIDAEPENAAAMNLVTAIPMFARSAAMIARMEPCVLIKVLKFGVVSNIPGF
jgi:hypothetical protein